MQNIGIKESYSFNGYAIKGKGKNENNYYLDSLVDWSNHGIQGCWDTCSAFMKSFPFLDEY